MFAGGLTMAITGGVATMAGAILISTGTTDGICIDSRSECDRDKHSGLVSAGIGALVAGAVLIGIGVPLAVVGGRRTILSPIVGSERVGSALTITF
jgi:hypothetical protein